MTGKMIKTWPFAAKRLSRILTWKELLTLDFCSRIRIPAEQTASRTISASPLFLYLCLIPGSCNIYALFLISDKRNAYSKKSDALRWLTVYVVAQEIHFRFWFVFVGESMKKGWKCESRALRTSQFSDDFCVFKRYEFQSKEVYGSEFDTFKSWKHTGLTILQWFGFLHG